MKKLSFQSHLIVIKLQMGFNDEMASGMGCLGQLNPNMNTISSSILCFLWHQKERTKHVNSYITLPKKCSTTKEIYIMHISGLPAHAKRNKEKKITPLSQGTYAYLSPKSRRKRKMSKRLFVRE